MNTEGCCLQTNIGLCLETARQSVSFRKHSGPGKVNGGKTCPLILKLSQMNTKMALRDPIQTNIQTTDRLRRRVKCQTHNLRQKN